jgi:hypothetical protein
VPTNERARTGVDREVRDNAAFKRRALTRAVEEITFWSIDVRS